MVWHCWLRLRRHRFTGRWIFSGRRSVRLCEQCIFGRKYRTEVMI
jgi:hypothetical protein